MFGGLSTYLSEVFDCLPHELIIGKVNGYMFSLFALQLISNYLKLNNSDSSWLDIFFGVPQGSILTPILFKIFLSYLFLVIDDIDFVSYPDDNTIYCGGDTIDDVILSLQDSA